MTDPIEAAKQIIYETDRANESGEFYNTPHDRDYIVARGLLETDERLGEQLQLRMKDAKEYAAEKTRADALQTEVERIKFTGERRNIEVKLRLEKTEVELATLKTLRKQVPPMQPLLTLMTRVATIEAALREAADVLCCMDGEYGLFKRIGAKAKAALAEVDDKSEATQ